MHDRRPASDRYESGFDPNGEIQLNPPDWQLWHWMGALYPDGRHNAKFQQGHERFLCWDHLSLLPFL
jgi:hypothetical protein